MGFCSVRWCGKSSKTSNYKKDGITFHRFPKCPTSKEKWINATHRGDMWYPSNTNVICSRHFTPDCFYQMNQRRRLMDSAVPTLFLPLLTEIPSEVTVPVLELHAHDLDASASDNQVCDCDSTHTQSIPTATVQVLKSLDISTCAKKIHNSTTQDTIPTTSQQQRNLLQAPPSRTRTQAPESISAFDCPIKKRLCRRIQELKNVVKEKNVSLRKLRDANRKLKRRIISLKTRLGE